MSADEIEQIASEWLAREDRGLTAEEHVLMKRWLEESSLHKVSYLRLKAAWKRADRLGALKRPPSASRQASGTLSASQLVVLDGRSIYLDFYGFTLWDWIPSNPQDIKQIEIVRGPASAVWGANALTGVVNIITKSPRENQGFNLTLTGGLFDRDAGSTAGEGTGHNGGVGASYAHAANDTWSYKLSAGYFFSDPFPRPTGTVPVSSHPLDSSIVTGGATYPADRQASSQGERAFKNTSTRRSTRRPTSSLFLSPIHSLAGPSAVSDAGT